MSQRGVVGPMSSPGSLQRPFQLLGAVLAIGLVIAVALAAAGFQGLGVFPLQQAVVGLGVAVAVTTATLILVLLRIGKVLEEIAEVREENAFIRAQLSAREEKQHVLLLKTIGEKYATRLNQVGIITIPQLMNADATETANKIGTTTQQVEDWQSMGLLMEVPGIGPKNAGILIQAGIRNVAGLARTKPESLQATLMNLGVTVDDATAEKWVRSAGQHLNARIVKRA